MSNDSRTGLIPAEMAGHLVDLTGVLANRDSRVSDILKSIAISMDCFGVVVWQISPDQGLESDSPRLFVSASHFFADEVFVRNDLILNDSLSGLVIKSGEADFSADVWSDPNINSLDSFAKRNNVRSMISIPTHAFDKQQRAVSFYRTSKDKVFREEDIPKAALFAQALVNAASVVCDRQRHQLSEKITSLALYETNSTTWKDARNFLRKSLEIIDSTFACQESSVFLENLYYGRRCEHKYIRLATTWNNKEFKRSYEGKSDEGVTGWVLERGRAVALFDLRKVNDWDEDLRARYEGMIWKDSVGMNEVDGESGIPLSWMAVPILIDQKVVGVIRCAQTKSPPYHYTQDDLIVLHSAAELISKWWREFRRRHASKKRIKKTKRVSRHLGELSEHVTGTFEFESIDSEPTVFYSRATTLAKLIIPQADVVAVRIFDKENETLTLKHLTLDERSSSFNQTPIRDSFDAGEDNYLTKTLKSETATLIENTEEAQLLGGSRWVLAVSLRIREEVFGTLEVGGGSELDDIEESKQLLRFVAQQLALFCKSANEMSKLRVLRNTAKEVEETQAKVFQDLGHQLESPVFQALGRLQQLRKRIDPSDSRLNRNISIVSGLMRKATSVARTLKIFQALHENNKVPLTYSNISAADLRTKLIELAADNEALVDRERGNEIDVIRATITDELCSAFQADLGLIIQALNTVIDNAIKYSFPNKSIQIYAGLTDKNEVHITVSNEGRKIKNWLKCLERGYREEYGRESSGEGYGIGLWLVDGIMKSHRGKVDYKWKSGRSHVRLVFC